jgi:hypothetical protein
MIASHRHRYHRGAASTADQGSNISFNLHGMKQQLLALYPARKRCDSIPATIF